MIKSEKWKCSITLYNALDYSEILFEFDLRYFFKNKNAASLKQKHIEIIVSICNAKADC